MGTSIEWTNGGKTWNPVTGCDKVSPGCKNCYAETFAERFRGVKGHPYEQGFDLKLWPERLELPLHWKKPRKIFVNSMSDLFHERVAFEFVNEVWLTMIKTPRHTYQILTKRPKRMLEFFAWANSQWEHPILSNVWLGVSCEDQKSADERIPLLLQSPAAVRFVSAEPLLERVVLRDTYLRMRGHTREGRPNCGIDWLIIGGESGHRARQFSLEWARDLIKQLRQTDASVFVKQLGRFPTHQQYRTFHRETHKSITYSGSCEVVPLKLKDPKGGDMAEWPEDLRIREYPNATT